MELVSRFVHSLHECECPGMKSQGPATASSCIQKIKAAAVLNHSMPRWELHIWGQARELHIIRQEGAKLFWCVQHGSRPGWRCAGEGPSAWPAIWPSKKQKEAEATAEAATAAAATRGGAGGRLPT
eukprot:scaffold16631_cov18-Tisochrysis_lutea.AAC.1